MQAAVNTLQKQYLLASVSSPNLIGLEDVLGQAIEGDFTPDALTAVRDNRRNISAYLSPESIRRVLDPVFLEYGKLYKFPDRTVSKNLLRRIYREWAETGTPVTVQRRNPTFGAVTAGGSNTGNGTINRLTTSAWNYTDERCWPTIKTMTCVKDQNSGARKHEEFFEFRDERSYRDNLKRLGSGDLKPNVKALSAVDSMPRIDNPSFSNFSSVTGSSPYAVTSLTAGITNWTIGSSVSNVELVTSDYYRDFNGDTTPTCVRLKTNETLTQLFSVKKFGFSDVIPYYAQVAFKRESSCDGNFNLPIGAATVAVALSAQSGWTVLRIPLGQYCWFRNFNSATASVQVALDSRTTGTLLVDDIIFAPMTEFAGQWYAVVGGSTAFKATGATPDVFTFTDSIASDAVFNKFVHWGYDFSFPSASSPVIADPS